MMRYTVQIGTMNAQNNYTVIAKNQKEAITRAKIQHLKRGRNLNGMNIYIAFVRPCL